MTELENLLYRAGHRPPKHGKAWICAECPRGKAPAMKVDGEVYYCHRCQRGGNIVTLKRELGIEMKKKSVSELRLEQEIRLAVEVKLARIRMWQKQWRAYLIHRFRKAYDLELAARDRGKILLEAGLEVDEQTIAIAVAAAEAKEHMEHWLNWFDRLSSRELISEYEAFQRVMHEPSGRLETAGRPEAATARERGRAEIYPGRGEAESCADHPAPVPSQGFRANAIRQE